MSDEHRRGEEAMARPVGDRRQESLLEAHAARLDLVMQATNEGLWDWDLRTNDVHFSPRWKQMLGYADAELPNRLEEWERRVHPDDRAGVRRAIQEYLTDASAAYEIEHRLLHRDGAYRWICARGVVMRDDAGRAIRFVGSHADISERKRVEDDLWESQRSMATLLSNLPGMAYRCCNATDWRMEFVSEGALDLTGYRPDELVNSRLIAYGDLILPDDRSMVWREVQGAVANDEPFRLTYRITTAGGARKWVMEQGRGVRVVDGTLRALEGFITDVTDRVEARQELERREEDRTRELATLLEIARNVAATLELEPLLGLILDEVQAAVDYHGAGILILHDGVLVQAAARGPIPERTAEGIRMRLADARLIREMLEDGKPRVIGDVWGDDLVARDYRCAVTEDWLRARPYIRSWVGVPLQARSRTLGMMVITYSEPHHFTERHVELLTAVATQAAVAIENARLFEEAQGKAVLEERQRLARELHDSVSQALFGIGLGARTARTLIDQDPARAAEPLDYVLSLAEAGLAEMRALIFELRPEALEQEGLVAALGKQLDALRARFGIEVEAELPDDLVASPQVQEALYRIAQEALHNTVKHARATTVNVQVRDERHGTTLRIEDDGAGFDAGQSFPGHLGLHTMRERAENLGGTLRISSVPGEGATLEVTIPSSPSAQGVPCVEQP